VRGLEVRHVRTRKFTQLALIGPRDLVQEKKVRAAVASLFMNWIFSRF
jgi:hypothetical protein